MFWCCRFILFFVVPYVLNNQHQTVSAVEQNEPPGDKKLHNKGTGAPLKIQSTKSILLNYLHRISFSKTISGINEYESADSNEAVQLFQKIAGVSPGIISTPMPMFTSDETQWNSFVMEVIANWNNRHLVRLQWWNGNTLMRFQNWTDATNKYGAYKMWKYLIKDGSELNTLWKKELDKMAPYLIKLQSAGVVPVLEILPSIDDYLDICTDRPGVTGIATLYQISRKYLTKSHNLTSIIWNWSFDYSYLNDIKKLYPGSDYVDVASVVMRIRKNLTMKQYKRLINLVGDKPLSMEYMWTVPSLELLTAQPRWTWFTADDSFLELDEAEWGNNNATHIKATMSSTSVINKGNIDFFSDNN